MSADPNAQHMHAFGLDAHAMDDHSRPNTSWSITFVCTPVRNHLHARSKDAAKYSHDPKIWRSTNAPIPVSVECTFFSNSLNFSEFSLFSECVGINIFADRPNSRCKKKKFCPTFDFRCWCETFQQFLWEIKRICLFMCLLCGSYGAYLLAVHQFFIFQTTRNIWICLSLHSFILIALSLSLSLL